MLTFEGIGQEECLGRAPPGCLREASREHFARKFQFVFRFWVRVHKIKHTEKRKSYLGWPPGGTPEAPSQDSLRCRYHSHESTLSHFGGVPGAHFVTKISEKCPFPGTDIFMIFLAQSRLWRRSQTDPNTPHRMVSASERVPRGASGVPPGGHPRSLFT